MRDKADQNVLPRMSEHIDKCMAEWMNETLMEGCTNDCIDECIHECSNKKTQTHTRNHYNVARCLIKHWRRSSILYALGKILLLSIQPLFISCGLLSQFSICETRHCFEKPSALIRNNMSTFLLTHLAQIVFRKQTSYFK